jgi:DNA-binding transcriptional ArsR family regulator
MAADVTQTRSDQQAKGDVCEVFCYDPDKVSRLKQEVEQTRGLATLFKALADDTRVKIVYALAQEELCVCDVAHIIGASVATASHHLRFLRNIGLARHRKEGKLVFYSLDDHHVRSIILDALAHFKEERK